MSLAVGDLVAEVIRNADPARQQQALARLQQLAPAVGARGPVVVPAAVNFDAVLKDASGSGPARNFNLDSASAAPAANRQALQAVGREYEALFLQQMLQLMLPEKQDEDGASTLAAELTRTQMASALASQLAATGDLGIGQQIAQAQFKTASDGGVGDLAQRAGELSSLMAATQADSAAVREPVLMRSAAATGDLAEPQPPMRLPDVISSLWSSLGGVFEGIGGTSRAIDRLERSR
jgi:peptidoglycan hydrolase FlgJ